MFKLLFVAVVANLLLAPCNGDNLRNIINRLQNGGDSQFANKKNSCNVEDLYSKLNYETTRLMGEFLYQNVRENPYQTFATSPLLALSIGGAMGLYTKGNSHKEILKLLNLEKCQIKDVFEYALQIYTSEEGVKADQKLKIYADCRISFDNNFNKDFRKFNGDTENIDACKADNAAEKMNHWASSQDPQNETQDVISACEIRKDFGLYVIGTQTFIVNWNNPFNPRGMIDIVFHISNTRTIKMPSLIGDGYLKYADYSELDCQLVELPLKGNKFTVFLLIPNQVEGLQKLLKLLGVPGVFRKAYKSMRRCCINLNVPLGEVHSTVDVKKKLIAANYSSLFDSKTANFIGIAKNNNDKLYISQFRHVINLIGNAQVGNNTESSEPSSYYCSGKKKRQLRIVSPFAYFVMGPHITTVIGGAYFGNT